MSTLEPSFRDCLQDVAFGASNWAESIPSNGCIPTARFLLRQVKKEDAPGSDLKTPTKWFAFYGIAPSPELDPTGDLGNEPVSGTPFKSWGQVLFSVGLLRGFGFFLRDSRKSAPFFLGGTHPNHVFVSSELNPQKRLNAFCRGV